MVMFQSKIRLCEVFGIPLYLDFSLIILLLFFVTGGRSFFAGLGCAFLLLVSITAHELGHALTARSFGYRTRDITLSLLGGCASLIALPKKASQEFLTALAGPAVSFALSALGALGIALVAQEGGFLDAYGLSVSEALGSFGLHVALGDAVYVRPEDAMFVSLCCYFSVMNLMLGIFNLLPGFPMDGGRIFRSAMRPFLSRVNATYVAMVVGRVVAVFIGLRGFWNVTHGANWGFVTMMIAWMIWKEGYREYLMSKVESIWDVNNFRVHVSPPPYGGSGDESDVDRGWPRA